MYSAVYPPAYTFSLTVSPVRIGAEVKQSMTPMDLLSAKAEMILRLCAVLALLLAIRMTMLGGLITSAVRSWIGMRW